MTTGKEVDISKRAAQLFMAPSTHCEGGEDAVILVETNGGDSGQHLVSARVDGSAKKNLCPVSSKNNNNGAVRWTVDGTVDGTADIDSSDQRFRCRPQA